MRLGKAEVRKGRSQTLDTSCVCVALVVGGGCHHKYAAPNHVLPFTWAPSHSDLSGIMGPSSSLHAHRRGFPMSGLRLDSEMKQPFWEPVPRPTLQAHRGSYPPPLPKALHSCTY